MAASAHPIEVTHRTATAVFSEPARFSEFVGKVRGDRDFPHNFGLFIGTNEWGTDTTLKTLRDKPAVGDTIIGVSGLFTWDLFLARADKGVQFLVNIDPEPGYALFWGFVKTAFEACNDPGSFTRMVLEEIKRNPTQYFCERMLGPLGENFNGYVDFFSKNFESTFSNRKSFHLLRALFLEGRFAHVPIDLSKNSGAARKLVDRLASMNCSVDTLYTSNVEDILKRNPEGMVPAHRDNVKNFQVNLALLTAHEQAEKAPFHVDAEMVSPTELESRRSLGPAVFLPQCISGVDPHIDSPEAMQAFNDIQLIFWYTRAYAWREAPPLNYATPALVQRWLTDMKKRCTAIVAFFESIDLTTPDGAETGALFAEPYQQAFRDMPLTYGKFGELRQNALDRVRIDHEQKKDFAGFLKGVAIGGRDHSAQLLQSLTTHRAT